ncbi:hypothetical protein WAI453_004371 [Rhynchosporium graminicola]
MADCGLDTSRRHIRACSPENIEKIVADSRCVKLLKLVTHVLSANHPAMQFYRVSDVASVNKFIKDSVSLATSSPGNGSEIQSDVRGKIPSEFLLAFTAPAEHEANFNNYHY